jgi:hypothetical protein
MLKIMGGGNYYGMIIDLPPENGSNYYIRVLGG